MAPIYVAASMSRAREYPEASIMHYFRTLRNMYNAPQMQEMAHLPHAERELRTLQKMTYAQVLDTVAIFGDPAYCIDRLQWFKETFGMSQFICWFNTGGKYANKQVMESMRLFAERVMPYID